MILRTVWSGWRTLRCVSSRLNTRRGGGATVAILSFLNSSLRAGGLPPAEFFTCGGDTPRRSQINIARRRLGENAAGREYHASLSSLRVSHSSDNKNTTD